MIILNQPKHKQAKANVINTTPPDYIPLIYEVSLPQITS